MEMEKLDHPLHLYFLQEITSSDHNQWNTTSSMDSFVPKQTNKKVCACRLLVMLQLRNQKLIGKES
jgi:hypothetical protein